MKYEQKEAMDQDKPHKLIIPLLKLIIPLIKRINYNLVRLRDWNTMVHYLCTAQITKIRRQINSNNKNNNNNDDDDNNNNTNNDNNNNLEL